MEEGVARLEPRVARIEADVAHIGARVANVEVDLRDLRKSMESRFDGTSTEFKALHGETVAEFGAVRGGMAAEFKALRGEMAAGFELVRGEVAAGLTAMRTEIKEELRDNRAGLDRLKDRVGNLRIMIVILAMMVGLAASGSQSFLMIWQWLSHFK